MKRLSKVLSMLLIVAMMASLLCIPGLAEETEDPYAKLKEGIGYLAIGDSFTRGYGASDHWQSQIYENQYIGRYNCRNVDGSFPNYVAEAFGLNSPNDIRDMSAKMWPVAHNAVSTAYMLDLLGIDDGFRDDEFTYADGSMNERYSADLAYFGDPLSYNLEGTAAYGKTGEIMSVRDMIKDASLITLQLGQSDVVYKAQILGLNTLDLSDTASLPAGVANIVEMLYRYYNYWTSAYPMVLDFVKEVNPDAKVVLIGTMNPIQNASVSEDVMAPIGSALNIIMDMMNSYTKQCAEDYGYMFVDISNVETPSTEKDMTLSYIMSLTGDESGLMAHPTPAGYAQIGRMIVAAVEEELAKEAAAEQEKPYIPEIPKTFIQLDLGRFESIDYVQVDNKPVENYTMDGYVLTIPWKTDNAKNLVVAVKNDDGTVTVMTYSLSYENGYVAHRTYETNDAEKSFTTVVKTVVNKVVSFFKNIFGFLKK